MFILATVAAGVLTSFSASMLNEGIKYYIGNLWNADRHLNELRATLDQKLLELRRTLGNMDASLSHSGLPSDWLDELERCRYEIEDIEESMDLECKRLIVTNFLQTNINYVTLMQSKLANREHDMKAGLSKTQLTNSNYEGLLGELSIRGVDKSKIIEELTTTKNAFGVSIIGVGGIGKTNLARAIAAEASIKSHFHRILSPPPPQSHSFDSETVLGYIKDAGLPSKDQRVLILLDGMHSVYPEVWGNFRSNCEEIRNPESRVLITTQNPRVADVTGTSKYCLHPLLEEECFTLIHKLANANMNLSEADDQAIRHFKKELLDTCRGLPLLASQIGILLAAEAPGHRRSKITEITTSSLWEVPDLVRVLVNLKPVSLLTEEPNLRRYLAYCSLFPRDYEFKEDNLVQLWMAEGFTLRSREASYLEQSTRGYFDKLLSCSLFQTSASPPGEKPSYKLHGLFYDMALNVASRTFCQKHIGNSISTPEISSIIRHFSLSCDNLEDIDMDALLSDIKRHCSGLRTFLLFHESGKMIIKNPTFFQSLTRLRVLDLSHTNLTKLEPKSISELKYLRYLDLSHTPLEKLPKLSKSPELQVLKLIHCDKLRDLPTDLTKLTSLTSLQVNTRGLGSLPSGIGNLMNLQRLDLFIVGKGKGFKITELRNLNDLRNSLRITKLENVETKQEAQEAMLCKKVKLERLELQWSSSALNKDAKQVLQGLEPPKTLKELMIKNYCGAEFPEWLSKSEVCGLLESIHLDRCNALPSTNQLTLLKTLRVEAMHMISHQLFGRNGTSGGLPYIETLVLCDMPQLNRWIKLAAIHMPSLGNLQVEKCQSLLTLPQLDCLKSLEKLEISWCTQLKELPTLPASLKSLIIKGSDILKQRCQVGEADWPKIRGIQVVIDSNPVDTSQPDPATADHQSSSVQGTPNGDQQTSPRLQCTTTNRNGSKHVKSKGNRTWLSGCWYLRSPTEKR